MYFFNCTCLCLSGYKPYIIKKTKLESDCQIIGSAQNESFHERKMKRTCFNPCRGLRGFRRSRPAALPSIGYRGFAVAPMTLRASPRRVVVITSGTNGRAMRAPTGDELLPPPRAVPLPRRGSFWGIRRSKPAALPSIGYRGFAVAPITLRAPSRRVVVITSGTDSFHRLRAVPLPRRGRSWGIRRSRPAALPSIGYRGFAVAPITLRASSRSYLYNPGCRVATLLVLMGVMGFLGDLRGRNRNLPLIP